MPDTYDPSTAAIVAGTSQAIQNAGNIYAQARLNRATRKWNEKMFGLQRAQALEDWRMQNEYNHPSAQMARLREAGLNPNLVYGKGADVTAQGIRSTDSGNWSPQAPRMGTNDAFFSYYDLAMKNAQIDNLRAQNTVLDQEAILKAASALNVTQQTRTGEFDLWMKENLKDVYMASKREELRGQQIQNQYTLNEDERKSVSLSKDIFEAAERILTMRKQRAKTDKEMAHIDALINNLQKDATLKQLDINLREKGIQPGDNIFFRALAQWLSRKGEDQRYPYLSGDETDSFGRPRN